MVFPGHIRCRDGEYDVQSVQDHCRTASKYAMDALSCSDKSDAVKLKSAAGLAALLHDMGKFTEKFKDYIEKAAAGLSPARGSVNHTFAAVKFLLERYHSNPNTADDENIRSLTAELIAYSCGAHHGLFDCVDEEHRSGFAHRVTWDEPEYKEAIANFTSECADLPELDTLFSKAEAEISSVLERISSLSEQRQSSEQAGENYFYIGMLARLLLSAVIEGDRRDTAEIMCDAVFPEFPCDRRSIWDAALERVESKLDKLPANTPMNRARRNISEQCRAFAEEPGGIIRLNVPTGAGKTLSALRYALAHAGISGKSHIIFTSPLLSILEQNAEVLRSYIDNDSIILEHHSNIVNGGNDGDELNPHELLEETWDAPVIITTLVQLLNTLFDGRTVCIRRFHALYNSVIIIDEVQTVPTRMLSLFNLAVNFLTRVCGATVVLCSATQPCLESTKHPLVKDLRDMVSLNDELRRVFKRTKIIDAGTYKLEDIPALLRSELSRTGSLLTVCNTKAEASKIYSELSGDADKCFHLCADMCVAHRRRVLSELREALENCKNGKAKVLCVSTQVIEAGVDISFGSAVRFAAGMDSAIQTDGRVNRNAERDELATVSIINCSDENLNHLSEIKAAKSATESLLYQYSRGAEAFGDDLSSPAAIRFYYHYLYSQMSEGFQDYIVRHGHSIFSRLSLNTSFVDGCREAEQFFLRQAFKSAGAMFKVFDDNTISVIVPYEDGTKIIDELCSEAARYDVSYQHCLIQRAKPYTVSLYENRFRKISAAGGIIPLLDGSVFALQEQFYDKNLGVAAAPVAMHYLEV